MRVGAECNLLNKIPKIFREELIVVKGTVVALWYAMENWLVLSVLEMAAQNQDFPVFILKSNHI